MTGAAVNANSVLVSGNFDGPTNTGVTVNGVIAHALGKQFFATVPLVSGENKLEARATSPDGTNATDSVNVTNALPAGAAPDPIQVIASPQSGIAPLTVKFTVSNTSSDPIQKIEIDVDGNGSTDITTTKADAPIEHVYATPGVFQANGVVTDAQNVKHQQTLLIAVLDGAQMDQFFTALWGGMNAALINGDLNGAVAFLNQSAQRKYRPVFEALLPHMPAIIGSYSPLQQVSVSTEVVEYAVNRTINGRVKIFLIYFLKDENGVWRLDAM